MQTHTCFVVVFIGLLSYPSVIGQEALYADNGLSRGDWGEIDECPEGVTFAFDFKYEEEGQLDNTDGNAIMMYCHNNDTQITGRITSKEGNYGDWLGLKSCPINANIVGFRVRVLPDQGTWGDDQGVDNIQVQCSDGTILDAREGLISQQEEETEDGKVSDDLVHQWIEIDGKKVEVIHGTALSHDAKIYGDWGTWAICTSGAVAALKTRVEQYHPFEDDAGLCDVTMYCY